MKLNKPQLALQAITNMLTLSPSYVKNGRLLSKFLEFSKSSNLGDELTQFTNTVVSSFKSVQLPASASMEWAHEQLKASGAAAAKGVIEALSKDSKAKSKHGQAVKTHQRLARVD